MFPSSTAKERLTVGPRGASCFHGLELWERAPRLKDWEEIINQSDTLNAGSRSRDLPLSVPLFKLGAAVKRSCPFASFLCIYFSLGLKSVIRMEGYKREPRELTAAAESADKTIK